ncbi:MAG TPA: class I SAM-dependent methyltransferase [Azospirillaceae bacterium]|nr:class I SAM-dependent methyltransferase [Azospirillaceae bacterium]
MSIKDSFDSHAVEYDALRRKFIPCFDGFYGTALDLVGHLAGQGARVLDLGAGTGLMSAMILERLPDARLTLVDISDGMLDMARRRFGDRVGYRIADYAAAPLRADGEPPFDAVVSALSIHHLEQADKRALFARVFEALAPGGVFVNADQVAGPTPELDAWYDAAWVRQIRANGITERQLAEARDRQRHDRLAPLADQLRWLAEAGFTRVDGVFKSWGFVVYAGTRS